MWLDVTRLLLGLALMALHRPIASFILRHEYSLHGMFRARGWNLPSPPSEAAAHNIYFGIGAFICLISMARIWMAIH